MSSVHSHQHESLRELDNGIQIHACCIFQTRSCWECEVFPGRLNVVWLSTFHCQLVWEKHTFSNTAGDCAWAVSANFSYLNAASNRKEDRAASGRYLRPRIPCIKWMQLLFHATARAKSALSSSRNLSQNPGAQGQIYQFNNVNSRCFKFTIEVTIGFHIRILGHVSRHNVLFLPFGRGQICTGLMK